jgi:hypothetical protein
MKTKNQKTTKSTTTKSTANVSLLGYDIRNMNRFHRQTFGFKGTCNTTSASNPELARAVAALRPGEYLIGQGEQDRIDAHNYNRAFGYTLRTRRVNNSDSKYVIARVA